LALISVPKVLGYVYRQMLSNEQTKFYSTISISLFVELLGTGALVSRERERYDREEC
jgi:putative effector of murein hydrolase LrgA (UPF0299 family)